jgi:hypothetical protein
MNAPRLALPLALLALLVFATATAAPASKFDDALREHTALGGTIVLSWNDLGMHCMNKTHANFSVLPPFNNLFAQVIRRGDANTPPAVLGADVTVEYSIPGNTYSVGKTDFWTYAPALFGVTLPSNVGLTGKGLAGTLDPGVSVFSAHGIPVTPWPDADLGNEHPFQQALVIARDANLVELGRSTPVIPVSTELNCVGSGCHSSESGILNSHESVSGFNPNVRPILCARCHASPALGTTGIPEAGYFSFRMHDAHRFLDQSMSGVAECYRCHPGNKAQCLRGAMNSLHGLECQNCHGTMGAMANGIELGRVPWVQEPKCGTCHTASYAENTGTLFRNSFGHGGIMCEGCHNSTHADVPARDAEDNANSIALQGVARSLGDCTVCHGVAPAGAGPHGNVVTAVPDELLSGAPTLHVFPNPMRGSCTFDLPLSAAAGGRLIVYDLRGRIVRLLDPGAVGGNGSRMTWDGADAHGARVRPGTYFARWQQGDRRAAVRLTVVH